MLKLALVCSSALFVIGIALRNLVENAISDRSKTRPLGLPRPLVLCVFALCASMSAKQPPKYPPLPERVRVAKTIYLDNQSMRSDVFNHLYEPLSEWGRWKVVGDPSRADLRLILTTTSPTGKNYRFNRYWFLILTEPNSGTPILYISADIAISTVKGAARGLVKKLRERIEKAAE